MNVVETTDLESFDRFNEVADRMTDLQQAINRQQEALQEQFEKEFPVMVKDFFLAVPAIKSVTWTQYAPYFNDGDACTFSVHDVIFATDENDDLEAYRGEEYETKDEDDESTNPLFSGSMYSLKDKKILTKDQLSLCEKLDYMISDNESIMENMFGNGVIVVLRESGIVNEDYDHD